MKCRATLMLFLALCRVIVGMIAMTIIGIALGAAVIVGLSYVICNLLGK